MSILTFSIQRRLALLSLVLAFSSSVHAAIVTFGNAMPIRGTTDVVTTGTLVSAFNVGSTKAATVNGVAFAATAMKTDVFDKTFVGGASDAGSMTLTSATNKKGTGNFGGGESDFAMLSTPYQELVGPSVWTSGRPLILTLGNLTIGKAYRVQIWVNDGSAANAATGRTVILSSDAGSNPVVLDTNVGDIAGGVGQYVLGTFTANATTQTITLTGSSTVGYLSAVALYAVTSGE